MATFVTQSSQCHMASEWHPSGGSNHHLQSAAECGAFAWLNGSFCGISASALSFLLKFLACRLLVEGENNTCGMSEGLFWISVVWNFCFIPPSLRSFQPRLLEKKCHWRLAEKGGCGVLEGCQSMPWVLRQQIVHDSYHTQLWVIVAHQNRWTASSVCCKYIGFGVIVLEHGWPQTLLSVFTWTLWLFSFQH